MRLEDYCSKEKFPKTSQEGLSPTQQLKLDAFRYDSAVEFLEAGNVLSPEQQAVWDELQEKRKHSDELIKQLANAQVGESKLNPGAAPQPPQVKSHPHQAGYVKLTYLAGTEGGGSKRRTCWARKVRPGVYQEVSREGARDLTGGDS